MGQPSATPAAAPAEAAAPAFRAECALLDGDTPKRRAIGLATSSNSASSTAPASYSALLIDHRLCAHHHLAIRTQVERQQMGACGPKHSFHSSCTGVRGISRHDAKKSACHSTGSFAWLERQMTEGSDRLVEQETSDRDPWRTYDRCSRQCPPLSWADAEAIAALHSTGSSSGRGCLIDQHKFLLDPDRAENVRLAALASAGSESVQIVKLKPQRQMIGR